ncbi:hypothetical protein SDC9_121821 [bioreactor metagenome]|uniref:Uncharacterized protein n=1 Tax=bioreactor metagenome TaxID=1076179 RepID=A0A645CD78_9ZZZZ
MLLGEFFHTHGQQDLLLFHDHALYCIYCRPQKHNHNRHQLLLAPDGSTPECLQARFDLFTYFVMFAPHNLWRARDAGHFQEREQKVLLPFVMFVQVVKAVEPALEFEQRLLQQGRIFRIGGG